jgi:hypothetical protein
MGGASQPRGSILPIKPRNGHNPRARALDTARRTSAHWLRMLCQPVSVRFTADSVAASDGTGIELTLILPV